MHAPYEIHWHVALRILACLKKAPIYGLLYHVVVVFVQRPTLIKVVQEIEMIGNPLSMTGLLFARTLSHG